MKIRHWLCALSIIVLLPHCHRSLIIKKRCSIDLSKLEHKQQPTTSQEGPITIWVHGTRLPGVAKLLRLHCAPGLHKATTLTKSRLRAMAETLCYSDPLRFSLEHFYVFGWSGKLSRSARLQAARELYSALEELRSQYYKKYGYYPIIRIITHSHGGNVVLNLAHVKSSESNLQIHELILLACPVQQTTAELIQNALWSRVYCLYSTGDLVQVMDPQGLHDIRKKSLKSAKRTCPLFSQRRFIDSPQIYQAAVIINNHHPLHLEFTFPRFLKILSPILAILDEWYCEDTRKAPRVLLLKKVRKKIFLYRRFAIKEDFFFGRELLIKTVARLQTEAHL